MNVTVRGRNQHFRTVTFDRAQNDSVAVTRQLP